MFNLFNITSKTVLRGDFLMSGDEKYELVRTSLGPDRDFQGNPLPRERYAYNLVNVKTGKARVSNQDRLFVTTRDGVNQPLYVADLMQWFRINLEAVSNTQDTRTQMARVVEDQHRKDQAKANTEMVATLAGAFAAFLMATLSNKSDRGFCYGCTC